MDHSVHQDWLRRFREELRSGDMLALEASVHEAGLDLLLDPEFLALARQMDARQVVVLIATLGAANAPDPAPHERLLAAYQCLQGQLPVEEAAERCAKAVNGSAAFYRALLGSLPLAADPPVVGGLRARAGDLRFGVELLADANRAHAIGPLLKAWQNLDRSDLPWLRTCRALVARAKTVRATSEARHLAQAVRERLQDAPSTQRSVIQELHVQLSHLALKCRDADLALEAAQRAYAQAPSHERRFVVAKALMLKGDVAQAAQHTDALVREMALDPQAQDVVDRKVHYSFQVAAAEDTLLRVNRALRDLGLRPFLMSGTLLGYARDGALLPHDKDIDIGLVGWQDQFTVAQALLQAGHFHMDLSLLTGNDRFLISAHDLRNGMAVDFFMFHDRGDHYLHGIDFDFGFTQNFRFSKFGLRDVEFLGETFSVPDDIDTNLSENYGDWRTPATSYVVTVESPGLCDTPLTRELLVHIELMKTMSRGLNPERARRILDHLDKHKLPYLTPASRAAIDQWLGEKEIHGSIPSASAWPLLANA